MELWQVRKRYRGMAFKLRRVKEPLGLDLERLEERALIALALSDRLETELSVLRLARRWARARLRRLRHWVERAGMMMLLPARLTRGHDWLAAEELLRILTKHEHRELALYFRQLLDELAHLERRFEDTRGRLGRVVTLAAESVERLCAHLHAAGR